MSVVLQAVSERISYITLNRPDKRNALNPDLISGLTAAFKEAIGNEDVKVIVLKAQGQVFSAGADLAYLSQLQANTESENLADTEALRDLFYLVYTSPKMVIAMVEGHAIAGGCGLVSVCDIVFTVPGAKFGYTEVKIGFVPALVACFLVRKIGEGRVNEMLLSGSLIDAERASAFGLVNFLEVPDKIESAVKSYAENIVRSASGNSIMHTKKLIRTAQNLSLEDALSIAVQANTEVRNSVDCKRGIASFLKKESFEW